ncbi:hypothetical protein [Nostoc linckia]|nr:hypothetical protein [Nostoc linckia]
MKLFLVGPKVAKLLPAATQRLKVLCRWDDKIAATRTIILPL